VKYFDAWRGGAIVMTNLTADYVLFIVRTPTGNRSNRPFKEMMS